MFVRKVQIKYLKGYMIKLVIFDFDGVFTDGKIIFDSNGNAMKHYHAKDGMGIFRLHDAGFEIGVISGWPNNVSQHAVLKHLKITRVSLGSNGKLEILKKWCDELEITLNEVAYMGDDLNDVKVMKEVGFVACPNDSVNEVREIADLVCEKCGGKGAVRELCEYLIKNN
jgi:3-deoxy-D-manno-octulosonate 8-phosphate phosphatase (KDO 8-P phosphatase)